MKYLRYLLAFSIIFLFGNILQFNLTTSIFCGLFTVIGVIIEEFMEDL